MLRSLLHLQSPKQRGHGQRIYFEHFHVKIQNIYHIQLDIVFTTVQGGRAVKKMGFLGSPRRFLILPGDRTEERPVFSYLQAGFFTLFQPKFSEILLKMGIFSL